MFCDGGSEQFLGAVAGSKPEVEDDTGGATNSGADEPRKRRFREKHAPDQKPPKHCPEKNPEQQTGASRPFCLCLGSDLYAFEQ